MGNACTNGQSQVDQSVEVMFTVPEAGFSTQVRTHKRLGWKPDLPDFRDRTLSWAPEHYLDLPRTTDLRPQERFPLYDQGHLGSCTANAIGAAFHFDQVKEGLKDFMPSRLFIYYNERNMEGTVDKDAGAMIRDGMKVLKEQGVCSEATWPYDETKFTTAPSKEAYEEGMLNRCSEYAKVDQTLDDMKLCISKGFPFVFGFSVYKSFMTKEVQDTGIMRMPAWFEAQLGGHAVMAVGYDDDKQWFIIRNSWGEAWGDKGYFYMPYKYISNTFLTQDFWTCRFVEGQEFPTKTMPLPTAEEPAAAPGAAVAVKMEQ